MTHYLKFADQEEGYKKLRERGFISIDESGNEVVITASHEHAIDVIGPIWAGGKWDNETGELIEPPTLLEGWHINFVGEIPEDWTMNEVTPRRPKRVFA